MLDINYITSTTIDEKYHLELLDLLGDLYENFILGAYTDELKNRLYVYKRIAVDSFYKDRFNLVKILDKCVRFQKYLKLYDKVSEELNENGYLLFKLDSCLDFIKNDILCELDENSEILYERFTIYTEMQRLLNSFSHLSFDWHFTQNHLKPYKPHPRFIDYFSSYLENSRLN